MGMGLQAPAGLIRNQNCLLAKSGPCPDHFDDVHREEWKDGAEAYLGLTVAGFPNLYVLYAPNTNLGHNSIIYMLERQVAYALAGIRHVGIHGRSFPDVHPDVQDRFNQEIQEELASTVWEAGCTSWYRTESGKNTNDWPGSTFGYRKRTRYFDAGHYELVRPAD